MSSIPLLAKVPDWQVQLSTTTFVNWVAISGDAGRVTLVVAGLAGPEGEFGRFEHRLDPGPVGGTRAAGSQGPEEPPRPVPPRLLTAHLTR